ncbi:MAG: phosphate ABC transporter permease PstA [Deferrisomatales bacterium]|nr:phosphate ABC transporter permease PstA [Deferrisomatales bacterium]
MRTKSIPNGEVLVKRSARAGLGARGEPQVWSLGGSLALGVLMIVGFLLLILWNGIVTFWPKPIEVLRLHDGRVIAGERTRSEIYRPRPDELARWSEEATGTVAGDGMAGRSLYRIANFDLYNEDFAWVSDYQIGSRTRDPDFYFVERTEWGPFVGKVAALHLDSQALDDVGKIVEVLPRELEAAAERRETLRTLERTELGNINRAFEELRLELRAVALKHGEQSEPYRKAQLDQREEIAELEARHQELAAEAQAVRGQDQKFELVLQDVNGTEKTLRLSDVVRLYPANRLGVFGKVGVYLSRWAEFLTSEPREANTEGGVMPAIFGTFAMTLLMVLFVAPFGVLAALYLSEYAKQGRIVSAVRVSVNNLAGVPSIVYGVFGLGFFAYLVGGGIDQWLFPERLPSPTFGTGGLLWASLTLALMTVPVVIVATEEALSAVPQSMREGSLACGASKWQTVRNIVLPRAMPGIMTGLILAMARGAGEVAPLMLVGVVKLAPDLPIDGVFPYVHLERSFMHLGFHIFDVGFQSRNSEAGKPMVFVTTLLLIAIVALMNAVAIVIRNRLKRRFATGHF